MSVRVCALLLVAVLGTGCDVGFAFDARNDSDVPVIVLFGGTSAAPDVDGYLVPPHTYGMTLGGFGPERWRGRAAEPSTPTATCCGKETSTPTEGAFWSTLPAPSPGCQKEPA